MSFDPVTLLVGHPATVTVALGGVLFAIVIATMLAGDWWEERKQERENQVRARAGRQR